MADLSKIYTGMDAGPEAIQKNFEAINQDVENIESLSWSPESSDGLVAQSGWRIMGGGYRYIQMGNSKLVQMNLFLSNDNSNFTGNATPTAVAMPEEFSIPENFQGESRPDINWFVFGNNLSFTRKHVS